MPDPEHRRTMLAAIEILTAMFSEPHSSGFARERLQSIREEQGLKGVGDVCAGMSNLAAEAIIELSRQAGVSELELLRRFALNVQDPPAGS